MSDDKPKPLKIDILQMELTEKLPYWLSQHQQEPETVKEIRERNRAKWLASLNLDGKKGKPK